MKKASLALMALIAVLGFAGCDLFGGGDGDPTSDLSEWKVKGSFDSWTLHQMTIDAANPNLLSYTYSNLANIDYEFVVVDPDGVEYKYDSTVNVVDSATDIAFDTTGDAGINLSFTALKTSYVIKVNIAVPAIPTVSLVPGASTATPYTFTELAAGLKIKGDQFWSGAAAWTEIAGTSDGTSTVTWTLLDAANKGGSFGISSLDGFLKGVVITSPTAIDTPTTVVDIDTTGNKSNATISQIPNADSIYTITVTVDPTQSIENGKYQIAATLTTLGSGGWPRTVPSNIYLVGELSATGWSIWSGTDDGREQVAVDSTTKVATFTYTTNAAAWQKFKFALDANAGWSGLIGWDVTTGDESLTDVTASTVAITADGENLQFEATNTTSYTITVDFTTYVATGTIAVKVATP